MQMIFCRSDRCRLLYSLGVVYAVLAAPQVTLAKCDPGTKLCVRISMISVEHFWQFSSPEPFLPDELKIIVTYRAERTCTKDLW